MVNVLSGHSQEGAPVVIEDNPTYPSLIGRIEHRVEFGAMVTDFTQIREGALHRANGGYLVVEAKSLLANPMAWDGLKRALRAHTVRIEDISQFAGVASTVTLEPEPIPLDIKVVMIGDDRLYQLLYAYDEDFRELFKVRAEFAGVVKRDGELTQQYALFVGDLCQREGLRPFTPGAVARIVEEGARLAEDQGRVTTRFAEVADLVREASYFCTQAGREVVQAADVRMAVEERIYRLNYAADRYLETIQEGVVLIDTQGEAVGQINGLSVVQSAGYEFGLPSRISARTFMGKAGVVSIDREVRMSGPIHDKGQLILAAYLNSRFAQKKTLSVSATLTFEQLYSGVEGDSASSTELYALLSSLADAPIKQYLAVTGSVNQAGQVQAIGGANAKIEGFFALCKARGLSGEQGVLLPASNAQHLMLSDEVIEAVAQGRFHVYGVSTIEQGLELLTGISAGEPDAEGNYPEGTLYARVQAKLDLYNQNMKDEGEEEEEEDEERECVEGEDEDEGPAEEGDDPEASDEDEESDIILR
jgi:lon-related putative ATP-dependent protease